MGKQEELNVNESEADLESECEAELDSGEQQVTELEQLRQIVFGSAQAGLEQQLANLRQEMQDGFEQLSQELKQKMEQMQAMLEDNVHHLEDRIGAVDQHYEEKTAGLDSYANKISEELEMVDANGKQQDEELHKQLSEEVQRLTDEFTSKHNQTIELLEQVKKELNSSKTDRKTLANLLATMASNLETENYA